MRALQEMDLIKNQVFKNYPKEPHLDEPNDSWKEINNNIKDNTLRFLNNFWSSRYKKVSDRKIYKEFTKTKYQKEQGLFAMKLYLIATMTRKVVNGQIEELPVNLGEVHDFVEKRVKELENISFKNAIDFEFFFAAFEEKLSSGFYKLAFKSIHPTNIKNVDNEANERFRRYSQVYGAFIILEYLLSNNIIKSDLEGLKTPFFHAVFLYGMSINK